MAHYDGSHDMSHIRRVVALARFLHAVEPLPESSPSSPPKSRDGLVVLLSALLHDIGDKKYLLAGQDGSVMVRDFLVTLGEPLLLAEKVQAVCLGVSYSSESSDPVRTAMLVSKYPELAVVQDADRLDALGAVGVARCVAFGAARDRTLANSIDHFEEKLERLPEMMKTVAGRERARLLGQRLIEFKRHFLEESRFGGLLNEDGSTREKEHS